MKVIKANAMMEPVDVQNLAVALARESLGTLAAVQDGIFGALDLQVKTAGAWTDFSVKNAAHLLELTQASARSFRKITQDAIEKSVTPRDEAGK